MHFLKNNSLLILTVLLAPVASFANEAAAAGGMSWGTLSAGFGMGIAVLGAALAQGKIASSFMEGASRNPGAENVLKTPLILSLIFVETLVLFTVLVALMLIGKI
jgi:F-type H+-transporting ATPase subunit c